MTFTALSIANHFLDLAAKDGEEISPIKLEKLVYYAHGWHLALMGRPLIDEAIQAWRFGPVIRSLYHRYREFRTDPITRKKGNGLEGYGETEQRYIRAFLDRIWEVYKGYTDVQLANDTHAPGTPWDLLRAKHHDAIPKFATIPDDSIREAFVAELRDSERSEVASA